MMGQVMAMDIKSHYKRAVEWFSSDERRAKARALTEVVNRAFTEHPRDTGESYWQHLWFTATISTRFLLTTIVIMIHGVFPFLLTRAASDQIEATYRTMKQRIPKSRREAIDAADDYSV